MKLKCEYCGNLISDTDQFCGSCGANNSQYKRQSNETPRTIEELQQWYQEHNLPAPEVTRFFIGVDYKQPKAFGIYQDGERFIVYKNKDDGSRAIRYDGADEAYAVNELYMKLKERIAEQKARNAGGKVKTKSKADKSSTMIGIATVVGIIIISMIISFFDVDRGYYKYNGRQYYYLDDWYVYDNSYGDWVSTSVDEELSSNHSDYYESSYYDSSYGTSNFEDTTYYSNWEASNWDDDDSWSSGDSWSSDSGDWSSDW